MILSQQVRMDVVNEVHDGWEAIRKNIKWQKGDVFLRIQAHIAVRGRSAETGYHPKALSPNKWHHIAFQSNGQQITTIVNGLVRTLQHGTPIGGDNVIRLRPKDFVLGGFGKKIERPIKDNPWFWGSF